MKERLERLRAGLDGPLLVSNPVNVAYLSGFTGSFGYLLVDREQAVLFTDFRYHEQARQQAPEWELADCGSSVFKAVGERLREKRLQLEADHLVVQVLERMKEALPGVELLPVASPVAKLRAVKDPGEVEAIHRAQKLADAAFAHALTIIKPGVAERDVALEMEFFMRRRGATEMSFDLIVASGARSAMPHGVAGEKKIEYGDVVVLDLGCKLDGYCSDLTRTVFVGRVDPEAEKVYRAVLAAQELVLEKLEAGMTGREADKLAREALAEKGLGQYFGHGLGHGVGREVHEAPRLSPASEEVLEEGMVTSVEPGVYLAGRFGVRIEDLVVIDRHGCRNLTGSTKELICL